MKYEIHVEKGEKLPWQETLASQLHWTVGHVDISARQGTRSPRFGSTSE